MRISTESFLTHQTFSLRSNDWRSCSLERTVLHPVPNSSKIHRFTDGAGCRQIGYAASAGGFFFLLLQCQCICAEKHLLKNNTVSSRKMFLRHEAYFFLCANNSKCCTLVKESARLIDSFIQSVCVDCRFRLEKPPGRWWERDSGSQRCFTRILQCLSCVSKSIAVFQVAAQYFLKGAHAKGCLEACSCQ